MCFFKQTFRIKSLAYILFISFFFGSCNDNNTYNSLYTITETDNSSGDKEKSIVVTSVAAKSDQISGARGGGGSGEGIGNGNGQPNGGIVRAKISDRQNNNKDKSKRNQEKKSFNKRLPNGQFIWPGTTYNPIENNSLDKESVSEIPAGGEGTSGYRNEISKEVVNSATGNIVLNYPLLSIPGLRNRTHTISVYYNSNEAWYNDSAGAILYNYIGLGWTLSGFMYLYINSDSPEESYLRLSDGTRASLTPIDTKDPHETFIAKNLDWYIDYGCNGKDTFCIYDKENNTISMDNQFIQKDYLEDREGLFHITDIHDAYGNRTTFSYQTVEYDIYGGESYYNGEWVIPRSIEYPSGWSVVFEAFSVKNGKEVSSGGHIGTIDVYPPLSGMPAYSVGLDYIEDNPSYSEKRYLLSQISYNREIDPYYTAPFIEFQYNSETGGYQCLLWIISSSTNLLEQFYYEFETVTLPDEKSVARIKRVSGNGGSFYFLYSYPDEGIDAVLTSGPNPVYKWSKRTNEYDNHSVQHNYEFQVTSNGAYEALLNRREVYDNDDTLLEEIIYEYDLDTEHPDYNYDIVRLHETRVTRNNEYLSTTLIYDNNENLFSPIEIKTGDIVTKYEYDAYSDCPDYPTRSYIKDDMYFLNDEITLYGTGCDILTHTIRRYTLSDTVDLVTNYSYYGNGNLKEITFPSGLKNTYTYDNIDNLNGLYLSSMSGTRPTKINTTSTDGVINLTSYLGYSENDYAKIKYFFNDNGLNRNEYIEFVYNSAGEEEAVYIYNEKSENGDPETVRRSYCYLCAEKTIIEERLKDIGAIQEPLMNNIGGEYYSPVETYLNSSGKITERINGDDSEMVSKYEYDSNGRISKKYKVIDEDISIYSGLTPFTHYSYDGLGRMDEIKHYDKESTTPITLIKYSYTDSFYDRIKTDANGHSTIYHYDIYGRLKETIDGEGGRIAFNSYDNAGNLKEKVDATSKSYFYEYNSIGEIIARLDPNMAPAPKPDEYKELQGDYSIYYLYDNYGNLKEIIDSKRTIKNNFDQLGRITASYLGEEKNVEYFYDYYSSMPSPLNTKNYNPYGRLIAKSDPAINTYYYYDIEGRLTEKYIEFKDSVSGWLLYDYDRAGKIKEITYPDGKSITYSFDNLGRISNLKRDGEFLAGFSYGKNIEEESLFGFPEVPGELSYSSIYSSVYKYNKREWPDSIVGTHLKSNYHYDNAGNLIYDSSYDESGKIERMYSYDSNDQLLTYDYDIDGGINGSFNYDASGNRLNKVIGNETYSYSYTPYTDKLENTENNGNITAYSYDEIGNVKEVYDKIKDTKTIYTWNYFVNRPEMLEIFESGKLAKKIEYFYDSMGERVKIRVLDKTYNEITTKWFFRGFKSEIMHEYGVISSSDQLTPLTHFYKWNDDFNLNVKKRYKHNSNTASIDKINYYFLGNERVARENQDGVEFFVNDRLGNLRALLNENGELIGTFDYYPYGDLINNNINDEFLFVSSEYDIETGNYYLHARFYEPETGRFLSLDPIEDDKSSFLYGRNNPCRYRDRNGLYDIELDLYQPDPGPFFIEVGIDEWTNWWVDNYEDDEDDSQENDKNDDEASSYGERAYADAVDNMADEHQSEMINEFGGSDLAKVTQGLIDVFSDKYDNEKK